MKRRTFLKGLAAAFTAPLAFLGKTKAVKRKGCRELRPVEWPHSAFFADRQFRAGLNRVRWSKIGEPDIWPELNFVDLPTYDTCEVLLNCEDKLLWVGAQRDTFRVVYTGDDKYMPFHFEFLGDCRNLMMRV